MNKLDLDYQDLLKDILTNGIKKVDRTGTGTISVFGRTIRFKFEDGTFPILTTKKIHFKSIVTELLWFLRGDTNIKYLVDNGCNIWNGDAYKHYKLTLETCAHVPFSPERFTEEIKNNAEFAKQWGELGPIYGAQWRNWGSMHITPDNFNPDQIAILVKDLKNNPDSRRLIVNAWNHNELHHMVLPPCHTGFQCYTTELTEEERFRWWFDKKRPNRIVVDGYDELSAEDRKQELDASGVPKRRLSLMWNQRSVDTFLGLSFNFSSYALLLVLLAKECNMIPDEIIGVLGDTHLYLNHIEQAREQLKRIPYNLPKLNIDQNILKQDRLLNLIDSNKLKPEHFNLKDYNSHPSIKAPLSN